MTTVAISWVPASGPTSLLGGTSGESLAMVMPMGAAFPVGGIVSPSNVFHGCKPGSFLDERRRRIGCRNLPEGIAVEFRLGRDVSCGGCPCSRRLVNLFFDDWVCFGRTAFAAGGA